ncbi:Putative F-box domain-containing protein [Septoria linicola]|uniref:F-box domain-containing protein n=1 Tax=Septoria linicola TaxID=215465 RepID=A0A9Q9EMF4_9PEZI|nr:putative F-box domain-containing protein [Septoria linicola]USW55409.1 Putative F-box domain-containing protein [Septoria linicola]
MAAASDGSQAELLEHILSYLQPHTLAHARLVSRTWKNNIDASLICQKTLFNNDALFATRLEFSTPAGPILDLKPPPRQPGQGHERKVITTPIKLHPFLQHVQDYHRFWSVEDFTFRFWEEKLVMFEEEGLWRKQFITQPPVNYIDFHLTFYKFPNIVRWVGYPGSQTRRKGVTLGDLQDLVLYVVRAQRVWVEGNETSVDDDSGGKDDEKGHEAADDDEDWSNSAEAAPEDETADWEYMHEGQVAGGPDDDDLVTDDGEGLTKEDLVEILEVMDFWGHAELPGVPSLDLKKPDGA